MTANFFGPVGVAVSGDLVVCPMACWRRVGRCAARRIVLALAALALSSCTAKRLEPGASAIFVSTVPPPTACAYLGEITGSQGGLWTAPLTPDDNMVEGSRNDLKNQAARLGANRVHLQQATVTNQQGTSGGHTSIQVGNAYKCPPGDVTAIPGDKK